MPSGFEHTHFRVAIGEIYRRFYTFEPLFQRPSVLSRLLGWN